MQAGGSVLTQANRGQDKVLQLLGENMFGGDDRV